MCFLRERTPKNKTTENSKMGRAIKINNEQINSKHTSIILNVYTSNTQTDVKYLLYKIQPDEILLKKKKRTKEERTMVAFGLITNQL